MFGVIFWSLLAVALSGIGVMYFLKFKKTTEQITWAEFGVGMAICLLVVSPIVAKIGWHVAQTNLVTFNEYRNGWELQAPRQDVTCTKDGPCVHEYDCDPYLCNPHSCNCTCTSTDKDGNCTSTSCDTCWDTCYHDCPYVTTESSFSVITTLGTFDISNSRLPDNPQVHRWDRSVAVPSRLIEGYGTGIPQFWAEAQTRLSQGNPGPVTKRFSYENYILASDRSILKAYSQDIDRFKSAELLPKLSSDVFNFYLANKVYFVGYQPQNWWDWQDKLNHLNSALGSELQGDLHLVVTQDQVINSNPDMYALALKPYWQNLQVFDRDALSKNGIVVILGTTDGQTVTWVKAFTGMPIGNEMMLVALHNKLKGLALDPSVIIGAVHSQLNGPTVSTSHGNGALESVLWGLENSQTKFRRVSMRAQDKDDIGPGFLYLKGEIEPTGGQMFVIALCSFLVCNLAWLACSYVDGDRVIQDIKSRVFSRD